MGQTLIGEYSDCRILRSKNVSLEQIEANESSVCITFKSPKSNFLSNLGNDTWRNFRNFESDVVALSISYFFSEEIRSQEV